MICFGWNNPLANIYSNKCEDERKILEEHLDTIVDLGQ